MYEKHHPKYSLSIEQGTSAVPDDEQYHVLVNGRIILSTRVFDYAKITYEEQKEELRIAAGDPNPFGPIVFLIGPGKTEVGQAGAEVSNQFHKKRNTVQSPILGLWPSCDRMLKEFRLLDSQADDAVTARSCAVSEQP